MTEHSELQLTAEIPTAVTHRRWLLPAIVAVVFCIIAGAAVFVWSVSPTDTSRATPQDHQYAPLAKSDENSQLSYGTWSGEIKLSQPHGQGTLTYTCRRLISQFDPQSRVAMPGDYIIGEFDCGQLVQGRLYRTNGEVEDIILDNH